MNFEITKQQTDEKLFTICIDTKIYTGGTLGLLKDRTDNKILYKHAKSITHITASGEYLASSSYDCTCAFIKNGALEDIIEGPETEIKCIAFDDTNKWLAMATRGKTVWICTVLSGTHGLDKDIIEIESILEDHTEDVKGCVFYQGMLFTYGYDCNINVYQHFASGSWELVQCIDNTSTVWKVAFIYDKMYASTDEGKVVCYKLEQGWEQAAITNISCMPIQAMTVYKNFVVCSVNVGNLVFLDADLRLLHSIEKLHDDVINCVCVSTDGQLIGTCSDDMHYCVLSPVTL